MLLFSDLHLSKSTYKTCMKVLRRVHKEADALGCTVYFLGDFFDKVHSRGTLPVNILNELMRFFETEWHVPMVMIPGNHDYFDAAETEHGLTPFAYASKFITIYDDPVVVNRQLWVPWRRNVSDIKEILEQHRDVDVIFGHFDIVGFKMSASRISTEGVGVSCFPSNVPVYSGHYHTPQTHGNIRYLGSPYQLTLSEAEDEKALIVLDEHFAVKETIPIDIGKHQYKWTADELLERNSELREGDVVSVIHSNGIEEMVQKLKDKGVNVSVRRELQEVTTRIDDTHQMTPTKLLEEYAKLNSVDLTSNVYSSLVEKLHSIAPSQKTKLRNARPVSMIVNGFGPFTGPIQIALEGQGFTLISGECNESKTASNGAGKSLITAGAWLWACTGMIDSRASLTFDKNISIVNEAVGTASVEVRGVVDGENWSILRSVNLKRKSRLTFSINGIDRTRSTISGTQKAISAELFGLDTSGKGLYTWLNHNSVWSQQENTNWLNSSDISAKTEIRQIANIDIWTELNAFAKLKLKNSTFELSKCTMEKEHKTRLYDIAIESHTRNLRRATEWSTAQTEKLSRDADDIGRTTLAYERALSVRVHMPNVDDNPLKLKRRELLDAKVVLAGMKRHSLELQSVLPKDWQSLREIDVPPKSEKSKLHKEHCNAAKHARDAQLQEAIKEFEKFKEAGVCHTCKRAFPRDQNHHEHMRQLQTKVEKCRMQCDETNKMRLAARQKWLEDTAAEAEYKKNTEYIQKGRSLLKIKENIQDCTEKVVLLSDETAAMQIVVDKARSEHAVWERTNQLCSELKSTLDALKASHRMRTEERCPYDTSDEIVRKCKHDMDAYSLQDLYDDCEKWKLISQWTGTSGIQTYALEYTVKRLAQRTSMWLQRFFKTDNVYLEAYFDEKEKLVRNIHCGTLSGVLSGGQFRRAQLAAFMAWRDMSPYDFPLLIMDEACTAMDIDGIHSVQTTIKDWCTGDDNRTCFFISHEPEQHRDTSIYTNHTRIVQKRGRSMISEEVPAAKRQRKSSTKQNLFN